MPQNWHPVFRSSNFWNLIMIVLSLVKVVSYPRKRLTVIGLNSVSSHASGHGLFNTILCGHSNWLFCSCPCSLFSKAPCEVPQPRRPLGRSHWAPSCSPLPCLPGDQRIRFPLRRMLMPTRRREIKAMARPGRTVLYLSPRAWDGKLAEPNPVWKARAAAWVRDKDHKAGRSSQNLHCGDPVIFA